MAKTQDYTKMMSDMMNAFPMMDQTAVQDIFKTQAQMGEKMSRIVLEAAEQSTELSNAWTKETISRISYVSGVKEPADYTRAMTDFASGSSEATAEKMAAFAEIAKKLQTETVELMLAAGKDFQKDANAAVAKATDQATGAAKKATASAS